LSKGRGLAAVLTALAGAAVLVGCQQRAGETAPSATGEARIAASINDARFTTLKAAEPPAGLGYSPVVLKLQVLLDRARFSPGEITGQMNDNTVRALTSFERASGLKPDGVLDREVWDRLTAADQRPVVVTYPVDPMDVSGPFTELVPESFQAQSRLESLGYRDAPEGLSETFHMSPELLAALNPGIELEAGINILVPDRGADDLGTDVALVEVAMADRQVRVYGTNRRLLAAYPATVGSQTSPPPVGLTEVASIDAQPTYRYEQDKAGFGRGLGRAAFEIAPGPNNPVGQVWIELKAGGYGVHGTPEPKDVGKPMSHGGVRLTNWDARELARGVHEGTPVLFK
jgi:lipoprotein-anchoring transpeptidase ErfK/SrfK